MCKKMKHPQSEVLFVSLCESYGGLCGGSLWPFPNGEVTGQLVDLCGLAGIGDASWTHPLL